MMTRKTRMDARGTYPYKFADGTKIVLTPGVDGVTEADIAMLHRMDDNEVYNNVKHSKPPIQKWEKEGIERWIETHPYEDVPDRTVLSLDSYADDTSQGGDKEKDSLLNLIKKEDVVSIETQAVRDFVDTYLTEQQQMLYHRVFVEEETMASVAKDLGIKKQSVDERVRYIKKVFKKNFKIFLDQTDF
ncbi:MAG: hypothetical protein LUD77_02295 [Clostridiales bacterium]|nr:hypothetical protein [Clostridiales bacterium]